MISIQSLDLTANQIRGFFHLLNSKELTSPKTTWLGTVFICKCFFKFLFRVTSLELPHYTTPAYAIHVIYMKGAAWISAVHNVNHCEQQCWHILWQSNNNFLCLYPQSYSSSLLLMVSVSSRTLVKLSFKVQKLPCVYHVDDSCFSFLWQTKRISTLLLSPIVLKCVSFSRRYISTYREKRC